MKKILLGITIFALLFVTTACDSKTTTTPTTNNTKTPATSLTGQVHEHCTREASMQGNAQADLNYEIYYTGEVLNKVESTEKVTSTDKEILDQYEAAYKSIAVHYDDLKYYDFNIVRNENSVTNYITVDYDHVDIKQLIDIEGDTDNVFENEIPKVAKWKELTKKIGMVCEAA